MEDLIVLIDLYSLLNKMLIFSDVWEAPFGVMNQFIMHLFRFMLRLKKLDNYTEKKNYIWGTPQL